MPSFQQDIGAVGFTPQTAVDTSKASTIKLLGESALGLASGKATAEFVGEEFQASEVGPAEIDLDKELNLTQITRAYKQGAIKAPEANARVNAAVKSAINNNPMFAEDIRNRAGQFFRGAGSTSGFFTDTTEQDLEAILLKDQALADQQIDQDAARAGVSRDTYIAGQNKIFNGQQATLAMADLTRTSTYSAIGAQEAIATVQAGVSTAVAGQIVQSVSKGGLDAPEQIALRGIITSSYNQQLSAINAMTNILPQRREGLIASLDSWRDSQNGFVGDSDSATYLKKLADRGEDGIRLAAQLRHADVLIAKEAGGETYVNKYLDGLVDDRLNLAYELLDPAYKLYYQAGKQGQLHSSMLQKMLGQTPDLDVSNVLVNQMATTMLNAPNTTDKAQDTAGNHILNKIRDGEIAGFEALTSPKSRAWVLKNPEKFNRAFTFATNDVKRRMKAGGVSLEGASIEVEGTEVSLNIPTITSAVDGATPSVKGIPVGLSRLSRFEKGLTYELQEDIRTLISTATSYPALILDGATLEEWVNTTLQVEVGVTEEGQEGVGKKEEAAPTKEEAAPPQKLEPGTYIINGELVEVQ